ncbi:MAG: Demethylrebeccamycin-D-glucose O-methyltransferase [Syntrophorhabdus sp. PtaU1.Bin058]|nr:MAG: Demethylrebeccamycin-D-glucose O-methyltransferase [Syntrophorhabdus sp. PtaU1.Bin058]
MKTNERTGADDSRMFKKSVVAVYETETFFDLLKDVLHPGGLQLTKRALETAQVDKHCTVLDIACGKGESIFLLAKEFGCRGVGIDLSFPKIARATAGTKEKNFDTGFSFLVSDAEVLPFADGVFDVVLSECSFSVLPAKRKAASEIARVLKPGGRLVITDIVLKTVDDGSLPDNTAASTGLTLPCIGGAVSVAEYIEIFKESGLYDAYTEDHSKALKKIGYQMALSFGGLEEFLQTLSSELCCTSRKEGTESLCRIEPNRKTAASGKPGYALIRVTKPRY